jgi:tetratricopeptide (TPR) repeat protein
MGLDGIRKVYISFPKFSKIFLVAVTLIGFLNSCWQKDPDRSLVTRIDSINNAVLGNSQRFDTSMVSTLAGLDRISDSINYLKGRILSNYTQARLYTEHGFYKKAHNRLMNCVELLSSYKDPKMACNVYTYLGYVYKKSGNPKESLDNYLIALEKFGQYSDTSAYGKLRETALYSEIGMLFFDRRQNPEMARKYLLKAYSLLPKISDPSLITSVLHNLGMIYRYRGLSDSARFFYYEALRRNRESGNLNFYTRNLINLADLAFEENNLDSAQRMIGMAKEVGDTLADSIIQAALYGNLASIDLKKGDTLKAIVSLIKAEEFEGGNKDVRTRNVLYDLLYKSYRAIGRHDKAYKYLDLYQGLNDSLNNLAFKQNLEGLEIR